MSAKECGALEEKWDRRKWKHKAREHQMKETSLITHSKKWMRRRVKLEKYSKVCIGKGKMREPWEV